MEKELVCLIACCIVLLTGILIFSCPAKADTTVCNTGGAITSCGTYNPDRGEWDTTIITNNNSGTIITNNNQANRNENNSNK